jgi:iron complex outermembrane recepter protein
MKVYYRLFVFLLIISGSLEAQVDTTEYLMEEIMVTGTRVEQKIIDIPFSVQRIDQSSWIASRKIGVNDVLTSIPGLFLQSRYGNHDVRITIRGFGSRSNSGIRGVRILLDGIPESEPDGQTRIEGIDFTSIGRIEIVKGNSSSLYTNAPGGVINFLTDKYFLRSFALTENEFGSYDMWKNGVKVGLNGKNSRFMLAASYENYGGYRNHSNQYMGRLNSIYEVDINPVSKFSLYGYYVNTLIKLPGSLTLTEYNNNDTAANQRSIDRDEKRITWKGRIGATYNIQFQQKRMKHTFEVTGYGTIKDFDRTAKTYRLITRYGVGGSFRYLNKLRMPFVKSDNEFSLGGDLYYQTGPISEYDNIGGTKGNELKAISNETVTNVGFYGVETFPIIKDRLSLLITGRYDRVNYFSKNLIDNTQDTNRLFDKFTPKFALNLKLTPNIALYTSFGLGFDSPAFNEMDNYSLSSDSGTHAINPDLKAQKSQNIEAGIKGTLPSLKNRFFANTFVELTVFHNKIEDVIVPFTIDQNVYYRNAATSKRLGVEFGINTDIYKYRSNLVSLKGAYTFSDFKYDKYTARVIEGNTITERNYDGNLEPSNPKNLFSGELVYRYTFEEKYAVFAKTQLLYVGDMYVNDRNDDSLKTEAYSLINAQVGVDLTLGNVKLLAYAGINNIADKKYVAFININADRRDYYESGPRRNFFGGLTLGYMFNLK